MRETGVGGETKREGNREIEREEREFLTSSGPAESEVKFFLYFNNSFKTENQG